MSKTNKLVLSASLVAAILPLAQTIVEGQGKLWNASRDAFVLASAEFKDPSDAAKAVSVVITDHLHGNPGSARAYLSTLVWLVKNGHNPAELSMQAATDLRYPKLPKLAADDFDGKIARLTKKKAERAAKAAKEAEAEAEANAKDPRRAILSDIARTLAPLDAEVLALVAAEVATIVAALTAAAKPTEAPAEDAARTGTDG